MIFSIEGNIGSGKSTFVEDLRNKLPKTMKGRELIFLQEPVELWREIKDDNKDIIQLFYEDKNKYAFSFQMLAYITRLNIINDVLNKNPDAVIISERSVYTDCNVFAQMLHNQNLINKAEFQIYKLWFDSFEKNLNKHRFIFLNTNCQECMNRIKKRNRTGEQEINANYVEACENYHTEWLKKYDSEIVCMLDDNLLIEDKVKVMYDYINSFL
tara:strand:- start:1972 stop:2610 length:639 start_codon:yes stop_codon:yes gene_type:complete